MTEVVVRPGATDEYTIPFTHGWERRQIVGRMRRLKVEVSREEARAANLNPKVDTIELPGVDTVRLTDVQTGGPTWVLTGYSAEWDANRAGFTPGGDVREGDDAALITELIGEVDTWTAGSIADLTGPLSFVFSHAHRHEALRRIETNVPGEIRFRDFGTVDYVDRLGTDRSGSVTLSPDAGTIEGEGINITERGRELDGTHIRVLGAHEGEAQLFVNLVPEDDPNTYENEVRYSTPRWTEAADTDWDRWSDNDITDQSTLETEAESIGEELAETLVKAETTVPTSVGLNVGDTVRVVKDDADLDRDMRVHRLTRSAGTFNDSGSDAAVVDKVHLSTRTTLQTDDDAELEEIRKFNTGFQGSSVAINVGPFRAAVDSGFPIDIPFRYPDLEFENTATLQVRGLQYRTDSRPLEHSHNVDIDIPNHDHDVTIDIPDHSHSVTVTHPSHSHDVTYGVPFHVHDVIQFSLETTGESEGHTHTYDKSEQTGGVNAGFDTDTSTSDTALGDTISETTDNGGGFFNTETTDNGGSFFTTESSDTAAGSEAGIFTTGDTPSGVDVLINGSEVAANIGGGTFQTTVDVGGEFTTDDWNTITLSSDSLGLLQATLFIEGYDQIGRNV